MQVRKVAEAKGMNISDIHYGTKLSLTTVRRYWYGKTKAVSLDALDRLCRFLDVQPGELFHVAGQEDE